MSMRSCVFSAVLAAAVFLCRPVGAAAMAADSLAVAAVADSLAVDTVRASSGPEGTDAMSGYDRRVHRFRKRWASLIPTQNVIQYAGNMGAVSIGVGWDYGRRRQWETHLLMGYLPKFRSHRGKVTMTLKENFIPWSLYVGGGWVVEPLSCGVYLNTVFGHEFWDRQPHRYPDKYYPFLSTKVRINAFVGQRIEKQVPRNRRKFIKSVTAFYEVGTCDLYIRAMIQDGNVSLWDILGLSLGLKFQVF